MKRFIVPRIEVRHLLPPNPEVAVRLKPQHLHWQVGRYKERLIFGPGGLSKKRVWMPEKEGEQHNLVLTQTYNSLIPLYGFVSLADYAVVGTGTTAPNSSQTGLVNEVARTNADTSPPQSNDAEPTSGQAVFTRVREFTGSQVGGFNLTEWGFSPVGTSGANLMCRDLFRDGYGNPVVLTINPDQSLQLIYSYSHSYTPAIGTSQSVSVDIANSSVIGAQLFLSGNYSTASVQLGHIYLLSDWAAGAGSNGNDIYYGILTAAATPSSNAIPSYSSVNDLSGVGTTQTTNGRSINNVVIATSEDNETWYGITLVRVYVATSNINGAIFLAFNSGQDFTKSSEYQLTINEWVLTWGP